MLRMAEERDAEILQAIYAPYVTDTTISCEYEPPSPEVFRQRIAVILKDYPYLVYEQNGLIAGYAYAHRFMERAAYQWNVEMSVYVRRDMRHEGIGKLLYGALMDILKLQHVQNLYAIISSPNADSENFHEHFGFIRIGTHHKTAYKFGKWLDTMYFEKALGGHEDYPLPFLSIHETDAENVDEILRRGQL